ncbi:MAG TPA: hypothetical protein VK898_10520 [Chloroflexota bacterium]|nr:hypothetical protein [Chloroflexota bacterium]
MAASQNVVQAVQAAIVASAHLAAYEHVTAAAEACKRLGSLTSGRWRAAARDLATLEDDLQTGFASAAEELASRADTIGVPEDTLWTVGDAAGTLDLLRESALEELEPDARAARVLDGQVLFGASFMEDAELPDRGTTLLFGWPAPLDPASWPWQANWVVGDSDANGDAEAEAEELDLFETGELEGEESMLSELAAELSCTTQEARVALRDAAMALTRASLLAGAHTEDDEDEDDTTDGEL